MTNIEQLKDALSGSDPDPDAVLRSFRGKRARARHRIMAATGGAAAVVLAVVAGLALHSANLNLGGSSASSSSAAAAAGGSVRQHANSPAVPRASAPFGASSGSPPAPASGSYSATSCAGAPLKTVLAAAVKRGGSVIVATGTLTGKSVASSASAGSPPGSTYYAMTLRAVRTLAGPPISSGSTGWIAGAAKGSAVTPEGQSLWAPDGALFAIVTPAAGTGAPVGPVLRVAPVVNGQVIFGDAGCWSTAGLPARPYHGGLLAGVQGPAQVNNPALGPESQGLYAVPLTAVEKIAAEAAKG